MNKKYQVFISSTFDDLRDERRKVQDTILSMYQFPIGMEMFSADDEEQWKIIKETIDSSDYYVLIIGHRYGTVIESGKYAGISYTEKEYNYAVSKKIPVLAFLIDNNVPVLPKNIEVYIEKRRKLEEFINRVKKGRMVQWWSTKDDLANKVMNSLNKQINKNKRPGWIRSDSSNIVMIASIDKKLVGKYRVIYYSSLRRKKAEAIFSELEIFENGKAKFLNNSNMSSGGKPEYVYEGHCNCTDSNIYICFGSNVSNEKVFINLINSVGDHKRYIGLMFATSSNNIPVCVKVACIRNEIYNNVDNDLLREILMSKNKMFNNNAFILEDEAKLKFYSNDIFSN